MRADEFQIGGRYRNREGWYEVLEIEGNQIIVKYDSGTRASLESVLAARIFTNIEEEEADQMPTGIREGSVENFWWTIGAIARYGSLTAELPLRARLGFINNYNTVASSRITESSANLTVVGDTKWGAELRIYLPEQIANHERFYLPENVDLASGNNPGNVRINNNSFWWHLVGRLGFIMGDNQDSHSILNHIPEGFQSSFLEGYNYECG